MEKGNLIITRRIGESLIIGDNDVEVEVLGVRGNQVRLSIRADKNTSVHRKEIFMRIQQEGDNRGNN